MILSCPLVASAGRLVNRQVSQGPCSSARAWPVACDRVEDDRGVLRRSLLPDEVPGIDDHEAAGGQPLVEKIRVWERDYAVVAAVDDRDGHRDLRQQPGQHGQLLGIS